MPRLYFLRKKKDKIGDLSSGLAEISCLREEVVKYLRVLFMSEGEMECEINRQIGAASAVMWSLHPSLMVKKQQSRKVKLSIYWSICVPTPGHELCRMIERTGSRIQAA